MKEFYIRVPEHPDFDPTETFKIRADLNGFGHPTAGKEFDARVLDWWGGLKYTRYTPVRLRIVSRSDNLGNKPVWNVEVISGSRKPLDAPKSAELFK